MATDPLRAALELAYAQALTDTRGEVATYIPELSLADPDAFGLALATADGRVITVGDADRPFTIQSVSKAFAYCLALEWLGRDAVRERVGVEPSGDAFNAIEFDPVTRRPYNPMVNAGAITVAGLLHRHCGDAALDMVLERFGAAAGHALTVDEAVYRSESETGHRNRAIAHLLRAAGVLDGPVEPAVDLYFRLCAVQVTARDLALMGATLANMGTQPQTGQEVFALDPVRDTLAVMFSCGMYDYAGSWMCDVGIPAKSGVGGGLVGVVNRQLGIGSHSPRLDAKGNPVRGIRALRLLAEELGLHAFECTNVGSGFLDRMMA